MRSAGSASSSASDVGSPWCSVTSHRHGPALRSFASRAITERIGTAAAGLAAQRRASARDPTRPASRRSPASRRPPPRGSGRRSRARCAKSICCAACRGASSPSSCAADPARRGGSRARAGRGADAHVAAGGIALRDDRWRVRLLAIVDVAIGEAELTAELAAELLLGPFGGLDPLDAAPAAARAARRGARGRGRSPRATNCSSRRSRHPARLVTIDSRSGARRIPAGRHPRQRCAASDGSIEELLWIAWDRSGLATPGATRRSGPGSPPSRRTATSTASSPCSARRSDFVERRPRRHAPRPAEFLAEVLDAEVPEDLLAARNRRRGARHHPVRDRRARVRHRGASPPCRTASGRTCGRAVPCSRRSTSCAALDADGGAGQRSTTASWCSTTSCACSRSPSSRASERVVLAAVANDDEAPSPFFALLPVGDRARSALDSTTQPPLSLRGVTGRLRRTLVDPRRRTRRRPRPPHRLAELARRGLPGADPADWHGLVPPRPTAGPLFDERDDPGLPVEHRAPRGVAARLVPRDDRGRRLGRRRRRRHDPALGDGDRRRPARSRASGRRSSRAGASSSSRRPGSPSGSARLARAVHRGSRRVPRRLPRAGSRSSPQRAASRWLRRAAGVSTADDYGDPTSAAPRRSRCAGRSTGSSARRRLGRHRRPQDRPPDHLRRRDRRALRNSARTSSPTRRGSSTRRSSRASAGTHRGGRREAALRARGHRRQALPRGRAAAARRRRARRGRGAHPCRRRRSSPPRSSRALSSWSSSAGSARRRGCGCTGCGRCPVIDAVDIARALDLDPPDRRSRSPSSRRRSSRRSSSPARAAARPRRWRTG